MPWEDGTSTPRTMGELEDLVTDYADVIAANAAAATDAAQTAAEDTAAIYTDQAASICVLGSPMVVGRYYAPFNHAGTVTTIPAEGRAQLQPHFIGRDCVLDRAGVHVGSAGTSGAVYRVLIYADDVTTPGIPGALMLDTGTGTAGNAGDGTLLGFNPFTVSLPVLAGVIWTGAVAQGAAATRPGFLCYQQGGSGYWGSTTGGGNTSKVGPFKDSVSGAAPNPFGSISGDAGATGVPIVWLRPSA